MHFSNLLCHASTHSWKDSSGIARSSLSTAVLMASESWNFDDFLEFWKQKEVTMGQIWRVGWLLQYSNVIFGRKLPNSQGIMSWSIVMMKQPWPRFQKFSSFLPHWAHQTSQDVFVDVLINSLALSQKFYMNIKKSDQHHLGFGLEHPRLLGSWWQCTLSFKALPFGEWIVLKRSMTHRQ